ncbi:HPr kinase/phosphorylase [Roseovarius pelagicus]|uniref:Serine kinase n=1 Tax=Roseovarius pelagicus TaxID=2980108 RepID=A0ABY6DHW9_9RHOB|nr:serine kinase [Roseovarius pelagicus]UXX84553.1 serine kinase [Roseovarius pelagicus]
MSVVTIPHDAVTIHASCVALDGLAVLIRGQAGSGKSGLALQMIALGAELVADDRTCLWRAGNMVMAASPPTILGRIEARGVGILAAPVAAPSPLALIADMDGTESERLPPFHTDHILGITLPLVKKITEAHFAAALTLYLKYGRTD